MTKQPSNRARSTVAEQASEAGDAVRRNVRTELLAALNPASATPRYLQLAAAIRYLIQRDVFRADEALASERDLAAWTSFARITVRRAIEVLLREGILTRRQGSGTYVTRRIEQPLSVLASFTEEMSSRGRRAGSIWLSKEVARVSSSEALALGLDPGGSVLRLSRVRTAENEPLAIETAAVPASLLSSPDLVGDSLYAALAAAGCRPARGVQRLHASLATTQEAKLLMIPPGSAVLRIERRAFLANGRPIEFTVSAYRGDRYDFVATLRSSPSETNGEGEGADATFT
ncbi:GntR family transcriptional regulator [Bosea psychrotolerans]|uniref:GntR family transcriptional regulator n=1 Tax=Bosea psychrotolerans TaxID=1871628 RepID=A0A2S4LRV5_9HYPH|nr:GntR family transcriptional regulator [Bosea psychrotolerans]POR45181.1 GntR family transcriptional regulator [Bosea psychrotolerans]